MSAVRNVNGGGSIFLQPCMTSACEDRAVCLCAFNNDLQHTVDKMDRNLKVMLCLCPGEFMKNGNLAVFNESL